MLLFGVSSFGLNTETAKCQYKEQPNPQLSDFELLKNLAKLGSSLIAV